MWIIPKARCDVLKKQLKWYTLVVVEPLFTKVLPCLKFDLSHHAQLECEHDDFLRPPEEEAVGGEKGVEIDAEHRPHMSYLSLA